MSFRSWSLALAATACTQGPAAAPDTGIAAVAVETSTTVTAARSRYTEMLALMRLDPQDLTRAEKLYPLIMPLCADRSARSAFVVALIDAATAPSSLGDIERQYALDILEHATVACARNDVESGRGLLSEAAAKMPSEPRIPAIEARILAAEGRLDDALDAARRSAKAGSLIALPLIATIQAQKAKEGVVGYKAGLLDEALATVSLEPTGEWRLLELTSVLSTRARLLTERALWEQGDARVATLKLARTIYQRLSIPPFIEVTRQHALDVGCYDAGELGDATTDFCVRAAIEHGNLGAAFLAGKGLDPQKFDLARVGAIQALEARIAELPADTWVVVIARGDESELVPWGRPAALVLERLKERRPKFVLLDRTSSARGGAVLDRMAEVAGIKPQLRIEARKDILATGCVAALVAGRKAPEGCRIGKDAIAELSKTRPIGVVIMVGRDLDAELEDIRLYELPHALLSMRKPQTEKAADVHLKSLADAWLLAPSASKKSGSQRPK